MKQAYLKRWIQQPLLCLILLTPVLTHATTPVHWKETGFSISAEGMALRDVLEEFGMAYGVRVKSSTKDDVIVRGRLKADSGIDFLERLARSHQFRWFVYNDTLYVSPRNDNASVRLEVGEDAVQDAKAALSGLGLFESRFGWGELPDEGVVMVSGPREYVRLAREILLPGSEDGQAVSKGKQIMVFRLKYASAADRVIQSRGQREVIPGIKTILSGLLNGSVSERIEYDRKFDVGSEKRSREPKHGAGGTREFDSDSMQTESLSRGGKSSHAKHVGREDKPKIDADPTINALIIYDHANKRGMYKALIAELDTEPQQIEIEALIIDIDRSRLSELGAEWGVRNRNTGAMMNSTRDASQGTDLPIPGSTLLISNAARFYTRLKALEGSGEARVLAKPTVLTLDNVAAILDLSQTAFLPLVGERVADLANVTAGTMLRVVPRIVREGQNMRVRLEIDIEDGALAEPGTRTSLTRSTISTQAIIELQQTLMIGGYHAETRIRDRQGVPGLSGETDGGGPFRNAKESFSTKERLFLITPRLTASTGVTAPARSRAAMQARKAALDNHREHVNLPAITVPNDQIVMPPVPETSPSSPAVRPAPSSTFGGMTLRLSPPRKNEEQ